MTDILVPISPGELIDKLTILRLKAEQISDPEKLANIRHERTMLQDVAERHLKQDQHLLQLWQRLYEINSALWGIEDDIRACEARGDFGPGFVALARAVYDTNDDRAAVKKEINLYLGSQIIEEKSYHPTKGEA